MSSWNPIGKELVGKRVSRAFINNYDQSSLLLEIDPGYFMVFTVEGDCCSESWFYHVLGVDNLIGQKITAVEEIEMSDPNDGISRQESDALYGIKITTERGYVDIEFRCSSNGYYGGWANEQLQYLDEPSADYDEITTDWTCFIEEQYKLN